MVVQDNKKKGKQSEFTKATVRRTVNKVLNQIALDEETYVYQIIEDTIKEKYPEYFRRRKITV